jgi:hypothetical protein
MKAKIYRMLDLQARRIRRQFAIGAIVALSFIALSPRALAQSTSQPGGSSSSEQGSTTGGRDDASKPSPPSLLTPLKPVTQEAPYVPIRPRQRLRWFITETIGPPHLAGGLFTAAFGTAFDRPEEYGPHWGGFADRYGMRMTGIVTGNAMEASIGAIWGEDPRYFRVPDQSFKAPVTNIVRLTFVARHEDGSFEPAYARYIAISGNNFLSNQWRVESEADTQHAILRTAEGFAGRMAANAFEEFWPDVKTHILHQHSSGDD